MLVGSKRRNRIFLILQSLFFILDTSHEKLNERENDGWVLENSWTNFEQFSKKIKKESSTSLSNKRKILTLHRCYLHYSANFCTIVLNNFFSNELISMITKYRTQILKSYGTIEVLEVLVNRNRWWNFTSVWLRIFSELWKLFSRVSMRNCFGVISGNYLYRSSAFRKYKRGLYVIFLKLF